MKGQQTDNLQHPLSLKTRYWHKNCNKSQSTRKCLKPLTLLQSNAEAGKAFHTFTVWPTKEFEQQFTVWCCLISLKL